MKRPFWAITLATVWVVLSEFVRNEFLFKSYWVAHYQSLGLKFQTLPVNGALWTAWSLALAYLIYKLLKKFAYKEAILLAWLAAFLMMWITLFNLQTLPVGLLLFAVPLSLLEVSVAGLILRRLS